MRKSDVQGRKTMTERQRPRIKMEKNHEIDSDTWKLRLQINRKAEIQSPARRAGFIEPLTGQALC
jgi:hypothetical protein